ncbi:helix-turn-helix domain-containing protein [Aquisalibacillus elongatus]|uniref:Transcriptional regulator with XRE-family HTH domain n=1 Tax=Aquisalibacillus elongatus TaxID=485577 RepID=A0A3N5B988_9BACI|nr:helix-turn-helix domain-containing protein [Aquisalibacillus elongatus]RPF53953.1 transcriptional regulator with XRE-family HTH domain [Aquisalibacillus elongatus]
MDPREEIGKRIYELRRYFKITQKELCDGICTQAYISKIENGSLAIAADILFLIAERLGVDINYFYDSTYNSRVDYSLEVELEARELVKQDDYFSLSELIKREEQTPLMNNNKFKQFIMWHKSLCKRFIDKDYDSALELLDDALSLCNTSIKSYSEREIQILINKANLYIDIDDPNNAIKLYQKSNEALNNLPYIHDTNLLTMIYYNLSRTYYLDGQYNNAIYNAQEGIDHCKKNQSLYGFGQFYFLIGVSHMKLKNYSMAKDNFEQSKTIMELLDKKISVQKINENLDLINQELENA